MKIKTWILLCVAYMAYSSPINGQSIQEGDTLSVWVNGLCEMCKNRIEEVALKTRGVNTASWNGENRMLSLSLDPGKFKERRLHYNIASVGHDTEQLLAPDPVYDALPLCCKYRDFKTDDAGKVTGSVFETGENGGKTPLAGANIYWMGTTSGTITDEQGMFSIELQEGAHMLIVSFVGYGNDTIHLHDPAEVEVGFSKALMLDEVSVIHRIKPTSFSFSSAYKVQNISEKELTKAACCNLSESFETNPSVDVSFTDAVTGTRKIEMLGLAGPYVQITRENMPDVRGLSALYGLTYTPGPWIQGIQLNMGAGSVVNGFESITGQINVELKKPENSEKFYLNLYGNSAGRMEANINTSYALNNEWHGGLLVHGNTRPFKLDHNGDGFMDHPTGNQFIVLKRFKYSGENGLESQLGVKVTYLDQAGGQVGFDPETPRDEQDFWGSQMNTRRIETWAKVGKVFEDRPYTSIGFQFSGLVHQQDAYFGLTDYLADQQSLYSNLIYQSILGNTNHQYRAGMSFQLDHCDESLTIGYYDRLEWVPGVFVEYTFNHMDLFTLVAGLRADHHNNYGTFMTPRLHLRFEPVEKTVFRASAGRGQKTASIFAENIGIFASSRMISIDGTEPGKPYGLDAEVAWSYGLNFSHGFKLGSGDAVLNADYYHTRFTNQIIADLDQDPHEVHFYNLEGQSYSNSFQFQLDVEPLARYDIRIAYRFNDVKSTFGGELLPKPLTSKHRVFINMGYTTMSEWTFDITWNGQDSKRIPGTESNPEPYQLKTFSPAFSLINLQIGKTFAKRMEIYAGVENLFDFRQEDPIIASDDPFGPFFDSSLIWGPIFGRKLYTGIRFRIN
ncbi:MAG: TonB-dependent receptor [Bacteroidales bacterium]|nr:TonB-dependent receptor [Bacteroidales bacterium]